MKINFQLDFTAKKVFFVFLALFLLFTIYQVAINKKTILNYIKKISIQKNIKNVFNSDISSEITTDEIREISKSIVLLECFYDEDDDGQWDEKIYGSGTYIPIDIVNSSYDSKGRPTDQNDRYILTNAHVTQLKQKTIKGNEFNYCYVAGENGEKNTISQSAFDYDIDSIKYDEKNDFSLIYHTDYNKLYNGVAAVKPDDATIARQKDKVLKIKPCDKQDLIGERVYLFGYPGSAYKWESEAEFEKNNQQILDDWNQNKEKILENCKKYEKYSNSWFAARCYGPFTYNEPRIKEQNLIVTEGIISGTTGDGLDYYTSAKVDSGNSGGLAVSKIDGEICIVGVPTWVSEGQYSNLGLIQSWKKVKELYK